MFYCYSHGAFHEKTVYGPHTKPSENSTRKNEPFGAKRSNTKPEIELPILTKSSAHQKNRSNTFYLDRKTSRNRREIERQKAVLLTNLEQKLKNLDDREYDRLIQHESYASLLPQIEADSPFFSVPKKEHLLSSTIEQRQKLKDREKESVKTISSHQSLATCENISTWLVTTNQGQNRQNAKIPSIVKIKFNNMLGSKNAERKLSNSIGTSDLSLITSNLTRALTQISGQGQVECHAKKRQHVADRSLQSQDLSTISQIEYTRAYLQELTKK